jgi:hypothetical protein
MTPGGMLRATGTHALLHPAPTDCEEIDMVWARTRAMVLSTVVPPGERPDAPWHMLLVASDAVQLGWAQLEADGWKALAADRA